VGRDRHAVRAAGERGVRLADVAQVHVVGVLTAPGDLRPVLRVVEVGQARVVELEVAAAHGGQPPHLLGVGCPKVGPELLDVRVDGPVDDGRPAPVVDHARRRDRQLRHSRRGDRRQEREVVAEDRVLQAELPVDEHGHGAELHLAAVVAEPDRRRRRSRDPADLEDEVRVPRGPAELPVGHGCQAERLLLGDGRADRRVLHRTKLFVGALPRSVAPAGRDELRWSQQAADVVGAERGDGWCRHGSPRKGPRFVAGCARSYEEYPRPRNYRTS
jgi:hypothetical protein